MQHTSDFFHQRRANHLHGLLPRVSSSQQSLERLPRFGRITGTNLVLDHLQDRRFQVRIEWCPLIVRLVDSPDLPARSTIPLSFTSHLPCLPFDARYTNFLISPSIAPPGVPKQHAPTTMLLHLLHLLHISSTHELSSASPICGSAISSTFLPLHSAGPV